MVKPDTVTAGTLYQANERIVEVTRNADATLRRLVLQWIDQVRWRATEAVPFWVHVYFLAMRFANEEDARAIRKGPGHEVSSQMDAWLDRNRKFTARVVEQRLGSGKKAKAPAAAIPTTKSKLLAHIHEAIGDPDWDPTHELVAFVQKPKFELMGEEGLAIYAALLVRGRPDALRSLIPEAERNPIVAQILQSHGIELPVSQNIEADLLDSIYSRPEDDAPRAVYADWLMERGDPRGEFIAAQLRGDDAQSPIDLKEVAGVLRPCIRWDRENGLVLERGFPYGCVVSSVEDAAGAPEWSTVEILDVTKSLDAFHECRWPALRAVGGLNARDLESLLQTSVAQQLVALGVQRVNKKEEPSFLDTLEQFDSLRCLSLASRAFDKIDFRSEHPIWERIEFLRGYASSSRGKGWTHKAPAGLDVERGVHNLDGHWLHPRRRSAEWNAPWR